MIKLKNIPQNVRNRWNKSKLLSLVPHPIQKDSTERAVMIGTLTDRDQILLYSGSLSFPLSLLASWFRAAWHFTYTATAACWSGKWEWDKSNLSSPKGGGRRAWEGSFGLDKRKWKCCVWGLQSMGIFQARMLKWVALPFPKGSSLPRDGTRVSCIAGRFFTIWATRDALKTNQRQTKAKRREQDEASLYWD